MDPAVMRRRVAAARVARLATVDVKGRPHVVPCCFALDGETLYSVVDDVKAKSTRALRRLENIRIHPDVTLLVDHYEEDWSALWWVRLDGVARVLDDASPRHEAGTRLLVDKYEQYADASLSGPLIAVDITQWRAWP
jgi:PPOX class probable F420-dependent enzyme